MATAFFLIGLPASGKSTYLNSLDLVDSVVLSSDNFIDQIAAEQGKTYSEVFVESISVADKMFKDAFYNAINENKNIYIDRTNLSVKSRRRLLSQLPKTYNKEAIVFEIDENERQRRANNRAKETGKFIPESVIETMKNSYVYPSKDEGFTKIVSYKDNT